MPNMATMSPASASWMSSSSFALMRTRRGTCTEEGYTGVIDRQKALQSGIAILKLHAIIQEMTMTSSYTNDDLHDDLLRSKKGTTDALVVAFLAFT